MKPNFSKINIRMFGGLFIIIFSIFEILNLVFLLSIPIEINETSTSLIFLIFNLEIVTISTSLLWICFFIIVLCFLILGIFMIKRSLTKINDYTFFLHIFFIGMIILIISIIKFNLIYLIEASQINDNNNLITMGTAIHHYDLHLYIYYMWLFLSISTSYEIVYSLYITSKGLLLLLKFKQSSQLSYGKKIN